jgi:hypothetical protein
LLDAIQKASDTGIRPARIDLAEGNPADYRRTIEEVVYDAGANP